jgi:hypothetical protein
MNSKAVFISFCTILILTVFYLPTAHTATVDISFNTTNSYSNVVSTDYRITLAKIVDQSIYILFRISSNSGPINVYYNRNNPGNATNYDFAFTYTLIADQFIFDYSLLQNVSFLYISIYSNSNNTGNLIVVPANNYDISVGASASIIMNIGDMAIFLTTPNFNSTAFGESIQISFSTNNNQVRLGYFLYSNTTSEFNLYNLISDNTDYLNTFCNSTVINSSNSNLVIVLFYDFNSDSTLPTQANLQVSLVNACKQVIHSLQHSNIQSPGSTVVTFPVQYAAPLGIIGASLFLITIVVIYKNRKQIPITKKYQTDKI